MRAELILFGKRINMARQARRRALVAAIFAGFAVLMGVLWPTTHLRGTGAYAIWAAIAVCRLFLGGITPRGLVKPFNGKPPCPQVQPSPLVSLRLQIFPPVLEDEEAEFRNDERELNQRDRAHYLAYQGAGAAVAAILTVALIRATKPTWFAWLAVNPNELYFGLLLALAVLMMTLPQAILLWTEPDMEEGQ
jgi:hypothetical protein